MKIRVKLIRSSIGESPRNRKTVKALGLRRMNQEVVHDDTPSLRGMLQNIRHMVDVWVDNGK